MAGQNKPQNVQEFMIYAKLEDFFEKVSDEIGSSDIEDLVDISEDFLKSIGMTDGMSKRFFRQVPIPGFCGFMGYRD